jgi:putative transposase
MKVQRVERHIIKSNNEYYDMLDDFCFRSKNLYNFANYQVRKRFCEDGKFISYNELDKLLKQVGMDHDYRNMPVAQSAQQTLRLLERNWKSFFSAIKDYKKNPSKYTNRPKLPKYLDKKSRNILMLTNINCKLKNGIIRFPKAFNGFTIKTKVSSLLQVRILPRNKYIVVEVVYDYESEELKEDNHRYFGIDIGISNLLTVGNNVGATPLIINGKGLKSINQFYNKKMSKLRKTAKQMNKSDYTNRMNRTTIKRNNKVNDFIHKASKLVVDYAKGLFVNTIIIGNNKYWKNKSKLNRKMNQHFIGLPHHQLIKMIKYKAENIGINVIVTEESYTSGTSFLDNELPIKENYDKSRRIKRGLFKSNNGVLINADLNGAYQIIKKVVPNAFADGIEGVGLHPFKVVI